MGERYKIADEEELMDEGSRVIQEIKGQEVAVFNVGGEYHAILNYCVHQSGPLCDGEISGCMAIDEGEPWIWTYENDGGVITCPWHNWKFDIKSGENIKDDRYVVPTYDIETSEGSVYVII